MVAASTLLLAVLLAAGACGGPTTPTGDTPLIYLVTNGGLAGISQRFEVRPNDVLTFTCQAGCVGAPTPEVTRPVPPEARTKVARVRALVASDSIKQLAPRVGVPTCCDFFEYDLGCYSVRGPAYTVKIYGVASDWPADLRELITLLRELQAYVS